MKSKALFSKAFNNGTTLQIAKLSEEEEAKIRTLHDVESIRIFRACMEDAEFMSEDPERRLKIALALFEKRCDKVYTWIQKALDEKVNEQKM